MVKLFDAERFEMSGMLYFSDFPDADLKKLNQYEVFIKASKKLAHGDPEQESSPKVLKISLNDLDEPPVLQDLPGSIDGILYHKENFQDVALVDGGNPESVSYVGEEIYFLNSSRG